MNINSVSGPRVTTKRPREEDDVTVSETTKKTKQVAGDWLELLDTYTTINIFRNLDGVSLTRMAATAHRYRSMIRSDKCLSKKIIFEMVLNQVDEVSRKMRTGRDASLSNLACILVKADHPKGIEYFRKVKPTLRDQLKMFKALALKKHPQSLEFLPAQPNLDRGLCDYAIALAESKHPVALDKLDSLLRTNRFNMETLIQIGEGLMQSRHYTLDQLGVSGSWYAGSCRKEMVIDGDLFPKCAEILRRIVDLGNNQFAYHVNRGDIWEYKFLAKWINLMHYVNHPKTESSFNTIANLIERISPVSKLDSCKALGSYCIRSGHPEMLEFLNRAIDAIEEKAYKFELLLAFAKELSKTNHPKTCELLDRASRIALEQCNKGLAGGVDPRRLTLWSHQFSQLTLVMVSVNHPKWHEFFLRSLQLDSSYALVQVNLCKIWKALKAANNPKAGEVYKDLTGYIGKMPEGSQVNAFYHLVINMAAIDPLKAYKMLGPLELSRNSRQSTEVRMMILSELAR